VTEVVEADPPFCKSRGGLDHASPHRDSRNTGCVRPAKAFRPAAAVGSCIVLSGYAILAATPSSSPETAGNRSMTSGSWPGTTCSGESASDRTISKASYMPARSLTTL
jgi:hypothetical protein